MFAISCPDEFLVHLVLAVDFMASYFSKTHILPVLVDKETQLVGTTSPTPPTMLLLLSSDTAYQAQGCSVVFHVVESTDETIM